MAMLTRQAKLFIVTRLACFDAPSVVAKALKAELGVTASNSAIERYNPTLVQGKSLSDELKKVFEVTRNRFLRETTEVPIANKAVRLRLLQQMVDNAQSKGNTQMVSSLLEQAAKEVGDAFTNRQKVEQSGVVGTVPVPGPKAGSQTAEDAYKAMLGGAR